MNNGILMSVINIAMDRYFALLDILFENSILTEGYIEVLHDLDRLNLGVLEFSDLTLGLK
jgi:hypothetical protein